MDPTIKIWPIEQAPKQYRDQLQTAAAQAIGICQPKHIGFAKQVLHVLDEERLEDQRIIFSIRIARRVDSC